MSLPVFPEMAIVRAEGYTLNGVEHDGVAFIATTSIHGREAKAVVEIVDEFATKLGPGVPNFVARDLHRELHKLAEDQQ